MRGHFWFVGFWWNHSKKYPENMKKKLWEPFGSYLLNSTTNPAHFNPNWAGLAVLFSRQLLNGTQDFFSFSYFHFLYLFKYKTLRPMPLHFCNLIFQLYVVCLIFSCLPQIFLRPYLKSLYLAWNEKGLKCTLDDSISHLPKKGIHIKRSLKEQFTTYSLWKMKSI